MRGNRVTSGGALEFRGQVIGGTGGKFLSWLLVCLLALPAWIVVPAVEAALVDETAVRLPADSDDSYRFVSADVTNDGYLDVVVANRGQSRILINDGSGGFTDETNARLPLQLNTTIAVAAGDIDGDNDVDLVLGNTLANRILINDGSGNFSDESASRLLPIEQITTDVSLGDVDGDNDPDLLLTNRDSRNRLLINDGSGIFQDQSNLRLPVDADRGHAGRLVDLDGDGALDIIVANHGQQNRLLINNQLGVFTDVTATRLPAQDDDSLDVTFLDYDQDGDRDILVANGENGVTLLESNGGTFADVSAAHLPVLNDSYVIRVDSGDLDYDGSPDLLLANSGQNQLLLNDGSGNFFDATGTELPLNDDLSFDAMLLDTDNDLDLDALIATPQGQNYLLVNDIPFPRIQLLVSPDYIEVGDTVTIEVDALDEDGVLSTEVSVVQPDTTQISVTLTSGVGNFVPDQIGAHRVVVEATDNLGNTGTMSKRLNVQANDVTAPTVSVTVTPDSVLQGQDVVIQVNATDDRAVASTRVQVDGVEVPLDSSGQAIYAPLTVGALTVLATATDNAGNAGSTSATLDVTADVQAPVPSLSATPSAIDITNPIAVSASATDNVAVSSLTVTVTGPGAPGGEQVPINVAGVGSYTPYLPGTYTFELAAIDPAGNAATVSTTVDAAGIPDADAPVVSLSIVPGTTIPGGTVTLTVGATDNVFVVSRSLTINGSPVTLDVLHQATFVASVLGDYTAVATAVDPTGNTGSDTVVFSAVDPATDTEVPVVDITTPVEGSDIVNLVEFGGTVTDTTLVGYELEYAPVENPVFTTFATGSLPVVNGPLGTLDTTILDNGLYHIRLTAEDINGQTSSVTRDYVVAGDANPGLLQLTFVDLNIPVAGIPITVLRTYDSRIKSSGDFGAGWYMDINQGSVTHNRTPGLGWVGLSGGLFGGLPCLGGNDETQYHITYLKVSDRESYRFGFKVESTGSLGIQGACEGYATFDYLGGDLPGATLQVFGDNYLLVSGGVAYSLDSIGVPYAPEGLRLTTIDGRVIDFNADGKIERMSDRVGNQLVIQANAITHSSGTSIAITRDAEERVTRITDPQGNTLDYEYDANGDLVAFVDQEDNRTTFVYNTDHYLLDINDPVGNRATLAEYDASGRLLAVTNANGHRMTFDHDVDAREQVTTNSLGHVTTTRYDDDGNVLSVERQYTSEGVAKVATTTFQYDAQGNETLIVDPDGVTTQSVYNATNNVMQSVTDPGGLNITRDFTYNASGDRTGSTWPTGEVLSFTYDASGNPTGLQDPAGETVAFQYNASGRPTRRDDPTNGFSEMQYDSSGRMTSEVTRDAANNVLSRIESTYDANGNRLTQTVYRTIGGVTQPFTTTWVYDAVNRKVSETDPLGNVMRWEYNQLGLVSALVDQLGRRTEYLYDEVGDLVKTTYADGSFFIKEYDEVGNLVAETDRSGNRVDYDFDELGNRVMTWLPDGRVVRTVYTGGGRVAAEIGPNGARTDYEYDAAGRKIKAILPLVFDAESGADVRPEINYEYDASGTLSAQVDPRGNRTEYETDFATRSITTRYPGGSESVQIMDEGWRVSQLTDEMGNTVVAEYDPAGRLLSVTLPPPVAGDPAAKTSYSYDEAGNLLNQTDALGRVTAFEYDALNRMTRKILPGLQEQTYSYDAVGNLTAVTDYDGNTTDYGYDTQNRPVTKTDPGGVVESYTYAGDGKRSTVTDARGTTTYTYDLEGKLVGIAQPVTGDVAYSYDAFGRLSQVATANGAVDYTYDILNRLSSVATAAGTTDFTYDAAGNPATISYPNGVVSSIFYSARNRAVGIEHVDSNGTTLGSYSYVRNPLGRVSQIAGDDGSVELYAYDAIGRMISESRTGPDAYARAHEYDLVGNRSSMVAGGVTTPYTYDVNDRLTSAGATGFSYDDRGNLTQRDDGGVVTNYSWDADNRLTAVAGPAGTVNYAYDFDGNRVSRTIGASEVHYLVDSQSLTGVPQVLEEHDGSGGLLASYGYGTDLFTTTRAGVDAYYHHDLHGSTRLLTDTTEAVTDRYGYEGYGDVVASTGSSTNNYLYTGEQFDPVAGLYYLRDRYYDPDAGRFISRDSFPADPLDPMSSHPYLYAHADPINGLDPTGQFTLIGISISLSISSVLRGINLGKKLYTLCKLKDKLSKIEFLLGFLRGALVAGARFGGIQGLGVSGGGTGPVGVTQTTFEFKYEALTNFNIGDGIKEAWFKTQIKYGGDIPGGGPEPWFEVGAKTFKNQEGKIPGAYSSLARLQATLGFTGGYEETLAKYKTCGIDSLELLLGAEAAFNFANPLSSGAGKIFLKADFFGGLANYEHTLLTVP